MKALLAAAATAGGVALVPVVAVLALLGVGGAAITCPTTAPAPGAALAAAAPVPAAARAWIALTHTACPDLPTPWIAAVIAQESGFRPDAWAEDANGGTRGLFQLNAAIWRQAYGASWDADLDHNGVADIEDPQIHASTAGRYLCQRLDGVRRTRAAHPDWPLFQQRSDLDGLVIAHNAGEAWQPRYPVLPGVTQTFLTNVAQRVADWSDHEGATPPLGSVPGSTPGCPPPDTAATTDAPPSNTGAVAGDPAEVAAAVHRAQILARDRTGWLHWCDRLVCRAYGYTNSGYESAVAHWNAEVVKSSET